MNYIYSSFKDAKEYGSILNIKNIDLNRILMLISNFESNKNNLIIFKYQKEIQTLKNILNQSKILSEHYDVVITNPPYMGNSGMNPNLKDYLKHNYPNSKSDLFAVFIERNHKFCKLNGFVSMITQQSFMFLSTFEKLRVELINNYTIINMVHLGAHAFDEIGGEVVQATSFINRNNFIGEYNSTFHRLTEFNSETRKEEEFHNDKNMYLFKPNNFDKIPGMPIVYWVSDEILNVFSNFPKFSSYIDAKKGMFTGKNDLFLKYWYEIPFFKLFKTFKPYSKGGEFRRWYGNNLFVINWGIDGRDVKNFKGSGGC